MAWGRRGRSGPRKVATAEGAKIYGQPIGTIITADMLAAAKRGARAGLAARERTGMTDRRKGPRAKGVKGSDVRRVADLDKPERKRLPRKPASNLPEGHRYERDPMEERAARYEEAIYNAQSEDDLAAVLDVLEADDEIDNKHGNVVIDKIVRRASEINGDPAPEPEQEPEPKQAPEATAEEPPAEATAKDKAPSKAHHDKLIALLKGTNGKGEVNQVKRRAKQWHKTGYLDDDMLADINRRADRKRVKNIFQGMPKEKHVSEIEIAIADLAEDPEQHNVGRVDQIRSYIQGLHEEGAFDDTELNTYHARLDQLEEIVPDKTRRPFEFDYELTDADDTGDLTPEQRNFIIQPKELDLTEQVKHLDDLAKAPDKSAAGKELSGGAKIADVKNPDGMEQYIRAHPERFDVIENRGGATGAQVFTVYDKDNDETHFFKRATNDGPVGAGGDGINEVFAGKLGHAAIPDLFLDADFAERPEFGGNPLIRMTHIDERAKADGSEITFYESGVRDWDEPFADRTQPLALHIFDFLTNQNDRHEGNIGWYSTPEGRKIVPTDNGNAFNAYNGYLLTGTDDALVMESVSAPEMTSYADWDMDHINNPGDDFANKAQMSAWDVVNAYEGDISTLKADAEALIAKFQDVDVDAIMRDLEERFPNMDKYEQEHMRAAALIWKRRMLAVKADDIMSALTELRDDRANR